jgi:hypothetical protein
MFSAVVTVPLSSPSALTVWRPDSRSSVAIVAVAIPASVAVADCVVSEPSGAIVVTVTRLASLEGRQPHADVGACRDGVQAQRDGAAVTGAARAGRALRASGTTSARVPGTGGYQERHDSQQNNQGQAFGNQEAVHRSTAIHTTSPNPITPHPGHGLPFT